MIKRGKYPILEYSNQKEGIMSRMTNNVKTTEATPFPERAVFAFLKEEVIRNFVKNYGGIKICEHNSVSKDFPCYKIN